MATEVLRLDLVGRRRSLVGYTLGMMIYTFVVVALYPTFKNSASLDEFVRSDNTAAALFGVSGDLSSSGGWLNGNIFANFLPLVMLLVTIGYGAAAFAGQDEEGTLCLLVTLPVQRAVIALEKAATMVVQAGVLAAGVAACVVAGRSFDLETTFLNTVLTCAGLAVMGIDFGLLAMAVGARSGRRGTAIGTAAAAASASYLLSSLAPVVSWIRPARYASLFYWSVGHDQIATGLSVGDAAVLMTTGVVVLIAAVAAFDRFDVRSG
jgi:ABC-2 type transport system permease protein